MERWWIFLMVIFLNVGTKGKFRIGTMSLLNNTMKYIGFLSVK